MRYRMWKLFIKRINRGAFNPPPNILWWLKINLTIFGDIKLNKIGRKVYRCENIALFNLTSFKVPLNCVSVFCFNSYVDFRTRRREHHGILKFVYGLMEFSWPIFIYVYFFIVWMLQFCWQWTLDVGEGSVNKNLV